MEPIVGEKLPTAIPDRVFERSTGSRRSSQSWEQLYRHVRFSDEVKKWTAFDTMHTLNVVGMYR